ncbi:MAG: phospholipase A [Pseudoxanthomonas sp.]
MAMPFRHLSLLSAALPALALAQTAQFDPATVEACQSVESDAARLACYDQAVGRSAPGPRQADAAADQAKTRADAQKQQAAADARDRRLRAGAVFATDSQDLDALANAGKGSLLDGRWELAKDSKLGVFQMRAYKPVYLLPAFWTSRVNDMPHSPNPDNTVSERQDLQNIETKFQLSFKTKFVENLFGDNGDIWGAYTQSSHWQVYNGGASRPFRETNYEPEVMLVFRTNYGVGDWRGRLLGLSVDHQSNGRGDPLSRSWNRAILMAGFDRDNWSLMVRPWWHLGDVEDNPDIENYMGRGDVTLVYAKDGQQFSLMGRHSLRTGEDSHGAVQATWAFPIKRNLRGRLEIFHGYGESMIDYNHSATYIGLGISLLEWY